jgi:hypothetical protein
MPALMSYRKSLTTALISALLLSCAPVLAFEETPAEEEGNCAFAKQLQGHQEKLDFVNRLRIAKDASTSAYGEVFVNTVKATLPTGEEMELDTFSVDCLSCHDGISAPGKDVRYKNNSANRRIDAESVLGSHPIGMHYGSYAYANNNFKRLGRLDSTMVLVDGKIGCLTCHNPLNKSKKHLAHNNQRSKLCYACHSV